MLRNEGGDVAAHEAVRRAHYDAEGIAVLAAEYQTIVAVAQKDRWDTLLRRSSLREDQIRAVSASDARGPLYAALAAVEARGLDIDSALPELVRARSLSGAADIASVLHDRVDRWVEAAGRRRQTGGNLIAGVIPRATRIDDPDLAMVLSERDMAIEQTARRLAVQAIGKDLPWVRQLGPAPADVPIRADWMQEVAIVAAYRDRWNLRTATPVGRRSDVASIEQLGHFSRARCAVAWALAMIDEKQPMATSQTDRARAGAQPGEGIQL